MVITCDCGGDILAMKVLMMVVLGRDSMGGVILTVIREGRVMI